MAASQHKATQRCLMWLSTVTIVCHAANPSIHVSGSHYEVGHQIGQAMRDVIAQYNKEDPGVARLVAFSRTSVGQEAYTRLLAANSALYPNYMDELRGLADGSGAPFSVLVVRMLGPELDVVMKKQGFASCTDIEVVSPSVRIMAHNEDANALVNSTAFLVKATIIDSHGSYEYTAYTYPGLLAGMSFGFNSRKLVVTTNALFPKNVFLDGGGRYFMGRDILAAHNVSDAIARASAVKCASGFSVNLGSTDTAERVVNLELAPHPMPVKLTPITSVGYHYNNYLHSKVPAYNDTSSWHRKDRANSMPVPTDLQQVLAILGDTHDPQWPIYRTSKPPDDASTVATIVFDLQKRTAAFYTANPKLYPPWTTMTLP